MARALSSRLGWSALVSGALPRMAPPAEAAGRVLTENQTGRAQDVETVQELRKPSPQAVQQAILKTFDLHIGATLPLPTKDKRATHKAEAVPQASAAATSTALHDPFAGLPFRRLAERLGAHMAPAVEQMRDEKRKARAAAHAGAAVPFELPPVPHVLPFTRWASQSKIFQSTLIADDAKTRKKARLSWYHPDDTMVPRGWWKGGLLADLAYYKPFSRES